MNTSASLRLGMRLRAVIVALVWGIAESLALLRSTQVKRRL